MVRGLEFWWIAVGEREREGGREGDRKGESEGSGSVYQEDGWVRFPSNFSLVQILFCLSTLTWDKINFWL